MFDAAEIKALAGGGRGVTLMDLDEGETLLAAVPIDNGAGKAVEVRLIGALLEAQLGHRARKGKLVDSKLRPPYSLQRLPEKTA